jgi:hypothetical protein
MPRSLVSRRRQILRTQFDFLFAFNRYFHALKETREISSLRRTDGFGIAFEYPENPTVISQTRPLGTEYRGILRNDSRYHIGNVCGQPQRNNPTG